MDQTFPLISEVQRLLQPVREVASLDLDEVDTHLRAGKQTQKNQALQELVVLERRLRELVDQDTAALIPYGPRERQEVYAALAEDEGEALTVEANALYDRLAKLIEPFLGPERRFNPDTAQSLAVAMYQVASELRLLSYVFPTTHTVLSRPCPTTQDLVALVKDLVRGANGDDFAAVYLSYLVAKKVLEGNYTHNVVPVIVLGATEDEAKGDFGARLFGGRTIPVDLTQSQPEKNDVIIAFKHLRPMFKRSATVLVAFNAAKARAAKAAKTNETAPAPADAPTGETSPTTAGAEQRDPT